MATQSQILNKLKSLGTLLGKDKGQGAGPYTNLAILCHKNVKSTYSLFAKAAKSLGMIQHPYGDGEEGGYIFTDSAGWNLLLCFYPQLDANDRDSYTVVMASLMKEF